MLRVPFIERDDPYCKYRDVCNDGWRFCKRYNSLFGRYHDDGGSIDDNDSIHNNDGE